MPDATCTTVDLEACSQGLAAERALGELPEDQRQVIEGISYEQAAAILKVPIGTIRSRLSRGRDALRTEGGAIDFRTA